MKNLIHIITAFMLLLPQGLTAQPSKAAQQQSVMETMLLGAVAKMQSGDFETAINHL